MWDNNPRYNSINWFPKKIVSKVATARKGPKGINLFPLPCFENIINIIPAIAPKKDAKKITSKTIFQPKKVPSIAASLISPPPILSFLKNLSPKIAIKYKIPPPAKKPIRDSRKGGDCAKIENIKPITIPGSVMTSGIN